MGALGDYMTEMAAGIFIDPDKLAVAISYTPKATGVPHAINGNVVFNDSNIDRFPDATYDSESATLTISNNAITGVVDVVNRDKVTISGKEYYVAAKQEPMLDGMWNILLNRTTLETRGNRRTER